MNATTYNATVKVTNGTSVQMHHLQITGINPDDACVNLRQKFCYPDGTLFIGTDCKPIDICVVKLCAVNTCEI